MHGLVLRAAHEDQQAPRRSTLKWRVIETTSATAQSVRRARQIMRERWRPRGRVGAEDSPATPPRTPALNSVFSVFTATIGAGPFDDSSSAGDGDATLFVASSVETIRVTTLPCIRVHMKGSPRLPIPHPPPVRIGPHASHGCTRRGVWRARQRNQYERR